MTLRSSHQLDVTVDRQVQQGLGRGGMQGTVADTRGKAGRCWLGAIVIEFCIVTN